jgi:hypothetical protein
MDRSLAVLVIGGVLVSQIVAAGAQSQQSSSTQLALEHENASVKLPMLPAAPQGKSTILGGEIQNIDPVRDQLRLKAFGQKPMTILFDERTLLFLDGKKLPLHDLDAGANASIQTVLDGTDVFALSIHLLSEAPEGEFQGQVISYDSRTSELTVSAAASREQVKFLVPPTTPISRIGQAEFSPLHSGLSDLFKGALVSLTFKSNVKEGGVASRIAILAAPGSIFVFGGSLSSLDLHSGVLILVDPRDQKSYQIFFDASKLPASQSLHEGDEVRVTTTYDGSRYVAGAITIH